MMIVNIDYAFPKTKEGEDPERRIVSDTLSSLINKKWVKRFSAGWKQIYRKELN